MSKLIAALLVTLSSLAGAGPWEPDVRLGANELLAAPAKQHVATHEAIEIVETQGCSATVAPPRTIRLAGSCGFLRGLYRYTYVGEDKARTLVLVEFSVSRQGTGHTLLVNEPAEISDSTM